MVETLADLKALGLRSDISEPNRGRRCWKGQPTARDAVHANRRRIRGVRGRRRLQPRTAAAADDRRGHAPVPSRPARGPPSSRVPAISRPVGRSEAFLDALPATLAADPLLDTSRADPLNESLDSESRCAVDALCWRAQSETATVELPQVVRPSRISPAQV